MNFETKVKIESKTCEGVTFTIHRLTEGKRIEITRKLLSAFSEIEKLRVEAAQKYQQLRPFIAAGDQPGNELDTVALAEVQIIRDRIDGIEADQIMPIFVEELLVEVNGLTIDGVNADKEATIKNGPRELYQEIVEAINEERGLTPTESGNSESPSTSTARVVGQMNPTSAEPVSNAATT